MNFFKPKDPPATTAAPPPSPPHLLHQTLSSLQTHFSDFLHSLQTTTPPLKNPLFCARISNDNNTLLTKPTTSLTAKNHAMSAEAIEERLAGVPVYSLSSGTQEFVLVSGGAESAKNLGLFCFGEADAEKLHNQMKAIDPSMSSGSHVVPVALSKIFQLKVDGVALRLIPEASQVQHALKERKKVGISDESFPGVPVFQSKSLVLKSQRKSYRPVFFRKEDLEKNLLRASSDQKQLNPSLRQGDIQVAVFEDVIREMKDGSVSSWDDVVFMPPGFDVSTDPSRQS